MHAVTTEYRTRQSYGKGARDVLLQCYLDYVGLLNLHGLIFLPVLGIAGEIHSRKFRKKGGERMAICFLEGVRITPEMPSLCHKCCLYLSTCMPVIEDGYLVGIECDNDNYCEFCVNYEICGQ